MASKASDATIHATIHPRSGAHGIEIRRGARPASWCFQHRRRGPGAHLSGMTNHTIAAPIRTWAELLDTDREVLNRTEVATLLDVDPRTIDRAIEDGTITVVRLGRRLLIPRRPFLAAFGVDATSRPPSDVS